MAKRYYNLEKETKEYLKACEARGIINQTNIQLLNDYVIRRKNGNLDTSFLSRNPTVLNNLFLWLDPSVRDSYPAGGSVVRDLTFNSNIGVNTSINFTNNNFDFSRQLNNSRIVLNTLSLNDTRTLTISLWVNFKTLPTVSGYSGDYSRIICELSPNFNNTTGSFIITNEWENPGFRFMVGVRGNIGYNLKNIQTPLPVINTWYNLVVTLDHTVSNASDSINFYLNGSNNLTKGITSNNGVVFNSLNTNVFGNQPLYIGGRDTTTASQDMLIGNFQIYKTILSPAEVLQNFNAIKGRFGL
jgi:hypothetical protein